jgi:hypothetical protein
VTDRPIRLVLDTSAILAFADGAVFGLPIACLAAAHWADAGMLRMLTSHKVCELLTVDVDEWQQWAAMSDVLGRLDAAAALLAASNFDCDVLTGEPDAYRALGDDPPIVGV